MAQITIKGFIANDVEVRRVGSKGTENVRLKVVDDSGNRSVGFFVDFWGAMVNTVSAFKKGNNVMIKADVENGNYEKEVNGVKQTVYGYNFRAKKIILVVEDEQEDLDSEMARYERAQGVASGKCIPVNELTPFDTASKK